MTIVLLLLHLILVNNMLNIQTLNSELDLVQVATHVVCDIDSARDHIVDSNLSLNIISQNIRSISCNMNNFLTLLDRSQICWDVIVLSECWLISAKNIPPLDNYCYATTSRHNTQNEGVVIYYKKNLCATYEEPEFTDANCLLLKINNDTCIISVYRPPSQQNINGFITSLDLLLSNLNSYKNIVLCGDVNIDICPNTSDLRSHEYLNLLATHSILPGHTIPTHGRTCLDHAMIKTKLNAICIVFETSITDHESVAVSIRKMNHIYVPLVKKLRIDFEGMDRTLLNSKFDHILNCKDANAAAKLLTDLLSSAIRDNSKSIKTPNRKRISKPWITSGLLRCMRHRDNLHRKLKKNPRNDELKLIYKRYRNYCNFMLKKAKRNYDRQEIENSKDNPKRVWEVIKTIYGSNRQIDHSPNLLLSDNRKQSLNAVNTFFSNIGKKLAEGIQKQHHNPLRQSYDTPLTPINSLLMQPPDESEVSNIIQLLKENTAEGVDQISAKIIKRYIHILTTPITHICNLAFSTGVFPTVFKLALIKPIHKGGDSDCVNNYRPISILPTMSKILERLINRPLVNFLESNNLISPNQYGFRRGKSTNDAVLELTHSVMTTLEERNKCLTIFLDIAKAFDTVPIPRLLAKLDRLGVRGLPLKLLGDYLNGRKQRVKIGDRVSDELCTEYGVPQGSIVSPTLFLAYINDLCQLRLHGGRIITFADDTALCFSGNSWDEVFLNAQAGFETVNKWLQSNMMSLNVAKTKYITFSLKSNLLPSPSFVLTAHNCNSPNSACNCPTLQRTDHIKYLGVIIDQLLTFKPHLVALVSRLRKLIYIFRSLRHVADRRVIKMVYYALCQALFTYCITTWGGAAKTHLLEVERAQRAILKVAGGFPYRYPTVQLYRNWSVLTIRQTFVLHIILKQHSLLTYDPFLLNDKRRKDKVCPLKKFNTSTSLKFFCFLGPFLYNNINKSLNIYPLHKQNCKLKVTNYLKTLSYDETENLLHPIN